MKYILSIILLTQVFGCNKASNSNNNKTESTVLKKELTQKKQKKKKKKKKKKLISNTVKIIKPIRVKTMTSQVMEEDTVYSIIKDRQYTLFPHGKITTISNKNNKKDTFQLNTENLIEEAHFLNYKNDLIIYYTDTDYETSASFIECYDSETYKLKWKNNIYGFNLTDPIVVDNVTYCASIGFVGKLNLDNGKYLWKHEDLYEKTRFDSFGLIEIRGEKVIYNEGLWINSTREAGKIIVNDNTGEIINIVKTQ